MNEFHEAAFTTLVAENVPEESTRRAIFDLLEFSKKNAFKVNGGKENRTFQYLVLTDYGSSLLFNCDSGGGVGVYLGNFNQIKQSTIAKLVRDLCALSPAFEYIQRFEDNRGGFHIFGIKETLVNPNLMTAFQNWILQIQHLVEP